MKAGTSSLYDWLTEHPDILSAREKELHFFDTADGDLRTYWAQFPLCLTMAVLRMVRRRPVVTGEATPYYIFHPLIPERVYRALPDARIIVLLRDPVDRAISHYWHEVRMGREDLSPMEAVRAEDERLRDDWDQIERGVDPSEEFQHFSYVARGHYEDQLKRWAAHFPSDQILVLRFEDLVSDPRSVYERSLRHLGIDPDREPLPGFAPGNVGTDSTPDPDLVDHLRAQFPPQILRPG